MAESSIKPNSNVKEAVLPTLKIIIIGDSGVGKTCLLSRFAEDRFADSAISTVGVDSKIRTIYLDGKKVKLHVWDTAGQERYRSITSSYYRVTHGIILMFDVTNRESFDNLKRWFDVIDEQGLELVTLLLVGSKCDLTESREVTQAEAKLLAATHGIEYIETSAKEDGNVEEAFYKLAIGIRNKIMSLTDTPIAQIAALQLGAEPKTLIPESSCRYCSYL